VECNAERFFYVGADRYADISVNGNGIYTGVLTAAADEGADALPSLLVLNEAFKSDKATPAMRSWVKIVHAAGGFGIEAKSTTDDDFSVSLVAGEVTDYVSVIASEQILRFNHNTSDVNVTRSSRWSADFASGASYLAVLTSDADGGLRLAPFVAADGLVPSFSYFFSHTRTFACAHIRTCTCSPVLSHSHVHLNPRALVFASAPVPTCSHIRVCI
jgi:hypothetical protein